VLHGLEFLLLVSLVLTLLKLPGLM